MALIPIDGKNPDLSVSQARIRLGHMHNYPRSFLNPIHSGKIKILYIKGIHKVLTKTIPQIQMFSNQILMVNMKTEIAKSRKSEVFNLMT